MKVRHYAAIAVGLVTIAACSPRAPKDDYPTVAVPRGLTLPQRKLATPPVITPDTIVYTRAEFGAYSGNFYPEIAMEAEVEGHALIDCQVGQDGRMDRCIVVAETPAGYDFGRLGAIIMVAKAKADPSKVSAGQWVQMTARFQLDDEVTARQA